MASRKNTPATPTDLPQALSDASADKRLDVLRHVAAGCSISQAARQVIGLHAGGRTIRLDADETILVAVTLEQERPFVGAEALAAGLRNAVAVTDLLALGARMKILRSPTGQG